jgi:DNA-binding MarR family transcriptional regulator
MKPRKVRALEVLIDECRSLFLQMRAASEEVHQDLGLSLGTRRILRWLHEQGPATVPQIARARKVSRQHIQMVVNGLLARELVEMFDNPAHRRSNIVQLTGLGHHLIQEMDRREQHIWRVLDLNVKRRDLDSSAGVLTRLRQLLDSDDWHRAVLSARESLSRPPTP